MTAQKSLPGVLSGRALLVVSLIVWPISAIAGQSVTQGVPLRNQNPFLQIFGLPPFQSANLASDGETNYDLIFDLVSHLDVIHLSVRCFNKSEFV